MPTQHQAGAPRFEPDQRCSLGPQLSQQLVVGTRRPHGPFDSKHRLALDELLGGIKMVASDGLLGDSLDDDGGYDFWGDNAATRGALESPGLMSPLSPRK